VGQAKKYADKLAVRYTYATNGQQIYAIDMTKGEEGDVEAFPTPQQLWDWTFGGTPAETVPWRERFSAVPFEDGGGKFTSRYYQDIAVERVLEAIGEGRDRILLTLATGTGKTCIAFQIAWKLFHAKWNLSGEPTRRPRILFLADRNILADQAYLDFSAFAEDALVRIAPDEIKKKGKVPTNGSVFFTIFQTFMSGPGDTPYFGEYPKDFFDFIIIDECHRGGANDESTWRGILDYFNPAVKLGLTATPKRDKNVDTYDYFRDPVFVYSLKEGINDGFLTPFKVRQITTTLDEYIHSPEDRVLAGEIQAGKLYVEKDFNKIIEIVARERYRVKVYLNAVDQKEKALIFCADQPHALTVRDLVNQETQIKDPFYCVRVTADDAKAGEEYLREYQDNEKSIPTVLTTSHKLSTGVNARNVRHIVLMRPVNDMIEFKQIIGRGTRLFDGKDFFTIHDFVKAHHHFADPEWDGDPEPDPCPKCQKYPCECEVQAPLPCMDCGQSPCVCTKPLPEPCAVCGERPCICPKKTKVKLADGKERNIQHMVVTTYWSPDGHPITAEQFLQNLYGVLPAFFHNEDELRGIWANPDTRKAFLAGLAEKGFPKDTLVEVQRMIKAEQSDLYDVLAYVAFADTPVSRETRAAQAKIGIHANFPDKQEAFLTFVLAQYVKEGDGELDPEKLSPLLKLKYNALADAVKDLGNVDQIRDAFVGFQKYLYGTAS
jgi:type I restriction enzyme R subunit